MHKFLKQVNKLEGNIFIDIPELNISCWHEYVMDDTTYSSSVLTYWVDHYEKMYNHNDDQLLIVVTKYNGNNNSIPTCLIFRSIKELVGRTERLKLKSVKHNKLKTIIEEMENEGKSLSGVELISKERNEMVTKHHNTIEADVKFNSVSDSNFPYIMPLVRGALGLLDKSYERSPDHWNPATVDHMKEKKYKDKLITAGALIAAEIDRLIYIELQPKNK